MPSKKQPANPAYELEKEALRDEIDYGLHTGVEKLGGNPGEADPNRRFHNTKQLLKQYRRVSYGVQMSESELNLRVELAHGEKLSTLEINAELAGIDLSDTKLERHARTVVRSKKMLAIIDSALECVKGDPDRGELLYTVLYHTYFTPRKPKNRDEILYLLDRAGYPMSSSSYHNHLNAATRAIDKILWGYTARDCIEIIKQFLPE